MTDLRASELIALGNCAVCGRKQLEGQIPLFYVVEISRAGFVRENLLRAAGAELMMGPLAAVLGPDEPLAKVLVGPKRVFVHEECGGIAHLLTLFGDET